MSEHPTSAGAAQGGLGTCGQCGWRGELHACCGCLERLCASHLAPHEAACMFALDILMRGARERVMRRLSADRGEDDDGGRAA